MTGNRRSGAVCQERDLQFFRELGVVRVVDREQAQIIAGLPSMRRANRRLLVLVRAGLLRRIFIANPRLGQRALYTLSPKSAALVGALLPGLSLRQSVFGASPFLLHRLAINDIYIALKHRALPRSDIRLSRWIGFREPLSQGIPLTPDGYFELASTGMTRAMFLEADLGSEALPVWTKKTQLYLQMALSGNFTAWFKHPQFRVLVIATTERRLARIRSAVGRQTDKIFWFATFEDIKRHGFWSPVWLRQTGGQRLALL